MLTISNHLLHTRLIFDNLRSNQSSMVSILTLIMIVSFNCCGLDVENPTPLSKPHWVIKSLPEEWPERGIDAHESGGIILEWEPDDIQDIVAYNIYRAEYFDTNDSLGDYELIYRKMTEFSSGLEYIDRPNKVSTKFYYRIQAENIDGDLSSNSDAISYTLLPSVVSDTMFPN